MLNRRVAIALVVLVVIVEVLGGRDHELVAHVLIQTQLQSYVINRLDTVAQSQRQEVQKER